MQKYYVQFIQNPGIVFVQNADTFYGTKSWGYHAKEKPARFEPKRAGQTNKRNS